MSKQPKKKVKVTPKQIEMLEAPHYASWTYKGVFQKYLSKKELEMVFSQIVKRGYAKLKLVNQIKHTKETLEKKNVKRNRNKN